MYVNLKILEAGQGNAFPDLKAEDIAVFADCDRAIIMAQGTTMGKSAVQFLAKAGDGKTVIIQLTAAMLDTIQAASVGARRRWGEDTSGAVQ